MKQKLRPLFALIMGGLGIYIGIIAIQQGADNLGIWCFVVGMIIEYLLLISGPETHHRKSDHDRNPD